MRYPEPTAVCIAAFSAPPTTRSVVATLSSRLTAPRQIDPRQARTLDRNPQAPRHKVAPHRPRPSLPSRECCAATRVFPSGINPAHARSASSLLRPAPLAGCATVLRPAPSPCPGPASRFAPRFAGLAASLLPRFLGTASPASLRHARGITLHASSRTGPVLGFVVDEGVWCPRGTDSYAPSNVTCVQPPFPVHETVLPCV